MTQIISIILLLFLPLFTSHTTSRRILHQPFFPVTDPPPPPPSPPPQTTIQPPSPSPSLSPLPKQPFSSITPTTPTHHHHHNHPFFFPLSTTPPTTTTTVPSTTLPTFPANISSITLPSPQPPSKSHVSKKLLGLSLTLSLVSILFISTMVATFLYHRSHHHKPQDDNNLLPPNHPTSDKPPPSLPPNSSTPSTEFLYLGTLFSPMHNHANTTNETMGSPELHPLPPLVRKVHGNVEEGFLGEVKEKVVVAAPAPPPPAAVAAGGGVKLKGLHWDKVRGSSDKAMVWDQFKFRSSFRFNTILGSTLIPNRQIRSWDCSWWRCPLLFNPSLSQILKGNMGFSTNKWVAKLFHAVCMTSMWIIWNWRNELLHAASEAEEISIRHQDIFSSVQRMSLQWASHRASKNRFSWDIWIQNPGDLLVV